MYVFYHVNSEGETSSITQFSIYVLVFLPDDGKEYNIRNLFRKVIK